MPSPRDENLAAARRSLLELIDTEHAVTTSEIEAKLTTESRLLDDAHYPHILTTARFQLLNEGILTAAREATRGGHAVATLSLKNNRGRTTAIKTAAARKRLLSARYLGWASGSATYRNGHVGPAGESAVRQAIIQSGVLGGLTPGAGEVKKILGTELLGPLDSGGFLTVFDEYDVPSGSIYVPIEVKNIRDWIYPNSAELYQLLHKAALLQTGAPTASVMPVLICRRINHTTVFLAKRLGFKVFPTDQQFIRPVVSDDELAEVRTELGFLDLIKIPDNTTVAPLLNFFKTTLAKGAPEFAESWRQAVLTHNLDEYFRELRSPQLRFHEREDTMTRFRAACEAAGMRGGW